jgi:hypothetical protein
MTFFSDSFNRSVWSFKLFKNKKTNVFFSIVNAKVTHLILYNHNDFFLNFKCNDDNSGPSCYGCSGYFQLTRLFFAQFSF